MFIRVNKNIDNILSKCYFDKNITKFKKAIESGETVDCLVKTDYEITSLISAVVSNSCDMSDDMKKKFFNALLSADAQLMQLSHEPPILNSCISKNNCTYYLSKLLKNGADINANTIKGTKNLFIKTDTPIISAVKQGSVEKIEVLLNHNPDLSISDKYGSPVLNILIESHPKHAKHLLPSFIKNGVNLNQKCTDGLSCIHKFIIHTMDNDIFNYLIDNGANINIKTKTGHTPIMFAMEWARHDIVDLLIKKNAKINQTNNLGESELMIAVKCNNLTSFKALIDHSADISMQNKKGENVMHYIIDHLSGSYDIVDKDMESYFIKFMKNNPDLMSVKNRSGKTPLVFLSEKLPKIHSGISKSVKKGDKNMEL